MKVSGPVVLAVIGLTVSACETLVRGMTQEILFETVPAGAEVSVSNGGHCASPCRLEAGRGTPLEVRIAKKGCDTARARLLPAVSDSFEEGTFLLRSQLDYKLGGVYDLRPDRLTVTLSCGERAYPRPPGLTPEDDALIEQFGRTDTGHAEVPLIKIK